ncbi:hypothetical protein D3C73_1502470 [compost metagenome]
MVSDRHGYAGLSVHFAGADDLYLRAGVQQGINAGITEPGRPGHAARHLANGADCADRGTGEPGVWRAAGVAGHAL